jgi:SAM-dependent methyltransferase
MISSFKYMLPYTKGKRVLDIGCNDGRYLRYFSAGSVGIDINRDALAQCREKGLAVTEVDINQQGIPFDKESFEVVFFSHVLEHLADPIQALSEAHRVLTQHGILILGLPVERNAISWVLREDYFADHPGHRFSFSVNGARHLLEVAGFKPQKAYFDFPLCRGRITSRLLNIY